MNVKLNEELIKLKDIINSLENHIKNNSGSKNTLKEFLNPKSVKMQFNGKEYILVSHRYYGEDKINGENTRLSINTLL